MGRGGSGKEGTATSCSAAFEPSAVQQLRRRCCMLPWATLAAAILPGLT